MLTVVKSMAGGTIKYQPSKVSTITCWTVTVALGFGMELHYGIVAGKSSRSSHKSTRRCLQESVEQRVATPLIPPYGKWLFARHCLVEAEGREKAESGKIEGGRRRKGWIFTASALGKNITCAERSVCENLLPRGEGQLRAGLPRCGVV
jgi:hypothetical protein